MPGPPGNAYICDFSTDSVRVFTSSHQQINAYLVGDGPISLAMNEAPFSSLVWEPNKVENFRLSQNYPNPFNPKTFISFQLTSKSQTELFIFNTLGQQIRKIFNGELPAGIYQFEWDGKNGEGASVPTGLYFYQLDVAGAKETKRMQLIR